MKTFCCEMCRVAAGESRTTMIVCPTCGNKRCPRAEYHENKCNGSNEPGPQRGPASVPQIEAQLIHNRRELKASEAAERPGEADKTCLCGHAKSKHKEQCNVWSELRMAVYDLRTTYEKPAPASVEAMREAARLLNIELKTQPA